MTSPAHALRTLEITSVSAAADGVVAIELADPEGGMLAPWTPGAHIDLHLPGGLVRAYSLCGDVADRRRYRIAVLDQPDGRGGSAALHALARAGVSLQVGVPRNNFELVPAPSYLFLAGGIGITPILPMLAAATAAGADWRLVYGARNRTSMAFRDAVGAYGAERTTLLAQDEAGLIPIAALLASLAPDTLIYACGPAPMLEAVRRVAREKGISGRLHIEAFAPVEGEADGAFTVRLARSGVELTVQADASILAVLEANGIAVECLCTDGYCGTCETPVLDGVPEHRDTVLSEAEKSANDRMMICVGRSRSPMLTLDL